MLQLTHAFLDLQKNFAIQLILNWIFHVWQLLNRWLRVIHFFSYPIIESSYRWEFCLPYKRNKKGIKRKNTNLELHFLQIEQIRERTYYEQLCWITFHFVVMIKEEFGRIFVIRTLRWLTVNRMTFVEFLYCLLLNKMAPQ